MIKKDVFQRHVEFLKKHDPMKRPMFLYTEYDRSVSFTTLARCFILHFRKTHPELIDEAILLMKCAIEKMLIEKDEDGQLDIDQIIWSYYDLAVWHANLKDEMATALDFANQGIEWLQTAADQDLCFGVRGQLWFTRWVCMSHLGQKEEAVKECHGKITETILKNLPYQSNSMLYYGYCFLAHRSKKNQEIIQAIQWLEKAANYIDLHDEVRKYELKKYHAILQLKESNPKECYEQLEKLIDMVSSLHQAWDFDPALLNQQA